MEWLRMGMFTMLLSRIQRERTEQVTKTDIRKKKIEYVLETTDENGKKHQQRYIKHFGEDWPQLNEGEKIVGALLLRRIGEL